MTQFQSDTRSTMPPPAHPGNSRLCETNFERLSALVSERCGIKLPPAKRTMLESRLNKRLRALGMDSFDEYCALLFDHGGMEGELPRLLDVVTTNTTEFFREPRHYDVLTKNVLPEWQRSKGGRHSLDIWSAGCSSGQEPYTLAMVLQEYSRTQGAPLEYSIMASDVNEQVLREAVNAVYSEESVEKIPLELKKRYLLRSKDRARRQVRVAQHLRDRISFYRLNFLEDFKLSRPKDIIFCRNVLIYFERDLQEEIVGKLCQHLRPGGVLFIGHSESLTGMHLPIKPIVPTVYRRL